MEHKKEKNALLIIDPQVGFCCQSSKHVFNVIEGLLPLFRSEIVCVSTFFNPEGSMLKRLKNWHRFDDSYPEDRELALSFPAEIKPAIFLIDTDNKVIDPLNGKSPLLAHLKSQRVTKVFICGVSSDCSILDTARGLFDYGILTYIIENACASNKDIEHHEAAMLLLKRHPGQEFVISSDQIQTHLS